MQTQLINFVIPKPLLQQVDRMAVKKAASRSQLIRTALKGDLEDVEKRKSDFQVIRASGRKVNLSEAAWR